MRLDSIPLEPLELHDAWRYVGILESLGEMDADEARRWRDGIFEKVVGLGLHPQERIWLDFGVADG